MIYQQVISYTFLHDEPFLRSPLKIHFRLAAEAGGRLVGGHPGGQAAGRLAGRLASRQAGWTGVRLRGWAAGRSEMPSKKGGGVGNAFS